MGTLKNILKAGIIAGVFVASVDVAAAAGNYPYDPFGCRFKIRTEMGIAPWTGNRYPGFWPRVGRCIAAHGNGVTATQQAASRAGGEARSVREPVVERKRKTREVEPRQIEAHDAIVAGAQERNRRLLEQMSEGDLATLLSQVDRLTKTAAEMLAAEKELD